jgi:lysyl-tRNA synthetase class 2
MPSTVIRHFAYDARSHALDVEFVSGRRYRYSDVPEATASRFAGAFSKGRFFNARIRDRFVCRELDAEAAEDAWSL